MINTYGMWLKERRENQIIPFNRQTKTSQTRYRLKQQQTKHYFLKTYRNLDRAC